MNRFPQIAVFAGLTLSVGMVGGSFISSPKVPRPPDVGAALASANDEGQTARLQRATERLVEMPVASDWAPKVTAAASDSAVVAASFIDVDRTESASPPPVMLPPVLPPTEEYRQQVRELIQNRFPKLDSDVLTGWVDTYSHMSLSELEPLLDQKSALPNILPSKTFSADFTFPAGGLLEQPEPTKSADSVAVTTIRQNLRHATTAGFRRRTLLSRFPIPSAASMADFAAVEATQFDFGCGPIVDSHSDLHLAIDGQPHCMFRLEPGCVLTRCGLFERLDDGSIGLNGQDQNLTLWGVDKIPVEATQVTIREDGTVHYVDGDTRAQTAGRVKLAVVTPETLQSRNGVYFTVSDPADTSNLTARDDVVLVPGAVEQSNVDMDAEWKLFDHYQRLEQLR